MTTLMNWIGRILRSLPVPQGYYEALCLHR